MQDEEELLKAAIRGDERALSRLLQHHYPFLFQYALKLTMNRHRAEDIAQDTMLKAIENISGFQFRAKFSTWLLTIASRLVIDGARRRERERKWLRKEEAEWTNRGAESRRMKDWPHALQALGELEEQVRIPVLLKYYYGYSQDEIADMLDIPAGTVKSRLHAGVKRLRKELADSE